MRNLKLLKLICFLMFIGISNSRLCYSQGSSNNTLLLKEKVEMISEYWKETSYNYCNPQKLVNIKWDSLYIQYLDQVIQCKNDLEYYLILQKFAAEINDGHSLIWNYDIFSKFAYFDYLPLIPYMADGKLFVMGISSSLITIIPLGSEIIQIGNMHPKDYMDKNIIPLVSGSTKQGKIYSSMQYLTWGNPSDSLKFQFLTPNGKVVNQYLHYNAKSSNLKMNGNFKFLSTFFDSKNDEYKLLNDSILYLRVNSFNNRKAISYLINRYQEVKNAKGIIIDLRYNRGGNEQIADSLLICFLNIDTLFTYKSVTRKHNAFYAAQGYGNKKYADYYLNRMTDTLDVDTIIKGELPFLNQPLVILIGNETCSAAEDLLIVLKEKYPTRAILLGEPTSGTTGAPLVKYFKNGGFYKICTRMPITEYGIFENGIKPDFFYSKKLIEYTSGKDEIIEIAKKNLKNNKANPYFYEGK